MGWIRGIGILPEKRFGFGFGCPVMERVVFGPQILPHEGLYCAQTSQAALARLRGEPSEQEAPIGGDIWSLPSWLATEDSPFLLQWVPSHFGMPGNEPVDNLAGHLPPTMRLPSTSTRSGRAAALVRLDGLPPSTASDEARRPGASSARLPAAVPAGA